MITHQLEFVDVMHIADMDGSFATYDADDEYTVNHDYDESDGDQKHTSYILADAASSGDQGAQAAELRTAFAPYADARSTAAGLAAAARRVGGLAALFGIVP